MYQCKNCGTQFEGNFCPECGTKCEEFCPRCGALLAPSAKFCSQCGSPVERTAPIPMPAPVPEEPAPVPVEPAPVPVEPAPVPVEPAHVSQPFFTENRLRVLYQICAVLPLALCGAFSFLAFLFCLAPAAVMKDVLFGTGSQSLGSVYDLSDAASSAVLAFAAIGLAVAAVGCLFLFVKPIAWREVPKWNIPLSEAVSWLFQAVWIGMFASACAICADVREMGGGMGALSVGAGPLLIIVFSVLFGLFAVGALILKILLGKKYPAFPEEERARRAEWKERYATPKAEKNADEVKSDKLLSRVRSVIRIKRSWPWIVPGLLIIFLLPGFGSNGWSMLMRLPGIALVVVGLVSLLRKKQKIGKRAPHAPLQYLRKSRANMIACAVVCSVFAAGFLAGMLTIGILWEGVGGGLSLQLGQIEAYQYVFDGTFVAVLFLIALGLALLSVSSCICAVACKKLPATMAESPAYEEDRTLLETELMCTPAPLRVRCMWAGFLTAAVADILITAIVLATTVSSNIFSEAKLGKIEIGASQYRVANVLGSADAESAGEWYYYSDNAAALMRKQEKLDRALMEAIMKGDERRIEALDAEIAALADEVKGMRYRTIRVLFDEYSTVMRVEMFYGETGASAYRSAKAVLSPARVYYSDFASTEFTYTASFSDTYVHARLGSVEVFSDSKHDNPTGIDGPGTYYLMWTDSFGNCSATLEVI